MRFQFVAAAGLLPLTALAEPCQPYKISITAAKSSTRWTDCQPGECNGRMQMFDITVNNTGTTWVVSQPYVAVTIEGDGLTTHRHGKIMRLRPGDSATVELGVQTEVVHIDRPVNATAHWDDGGSCQGSTTFGFTASYGIPDYQPNVASVSNHEAPNWYRDAKFGIFIHWGVYAVPAYKNEWYWRAQETKNSDVYNHHLATYGRNVVYDDFIANFTAANFDPKAWMDLISDTGAQYFVPTTKHHDGFALFNMSSSISNRNSAKLGPKRDLLGELFAAAKQHHPEIHRGTYFSIPEFFTPASPQNGELESVHTGNFYQGAPKNAYTDKEVPYTGFVNNSFISGIQLPQMNILANDYDTELMWCDIPSLSMADQFAANFFNKAFRENKPVVMNNRCGVVSGKKVPGDYGTPENTANLSFDPKLWEVCRTMDPNSWGYRADTPDSAYMTPNTIVYTLLDAISKGGNLLLNVGPKPDGTIKEIMQTNLRDAGKWIKSHSESIFGTKYWPLGKGGSGNFRYTETDQAFYIHCLTKPSGSINITDPIPWMQGDKVTVVGGRKNGTMVSASASGNSILLDVPQEISDADQYAWTFKITY
ncbi:glycoside hydrolase, family 29 [Pochonia chlamydosporia 170]|uniref:alpha-L-fucosidase n=1 Tax=Pochonia chlamydosporia 170 TaxID=1380566 RepID=A0A179EXZ1_METCM|nr:glycoside hydrolase, family 29 [Pochonia chlamydosporia 170]OAQ57779.1 glycoside hydrolase, family 29 [Pochonia chlamydosporia 170]